MSWEIPLDERGESLFIVWNGAFIENSGNVAGGDTFGQCAISLVHIPESERQE